MTTETILAERFEQTDLGTQETKLVRRGRKHVLIHDAWTGYNSLAGECLRPQSLDVPPQLVEAVRYAIANHSEPLGDDTHHTEWNYFCSCLLPQICEHNVG